MVPSWERPLWARTLALIKKKASCERDGKLCWSVRTVHRVYLITSSVRVREGAFDVFILFELLSFPAAYL
jgi:hypothetical protein